MNTDQIRNDLQFNFNELKSTMQQQQVKFENEIKKMAHASQQNYEDKHETIKEIQRLRG